MTRNAITVGSAMIDIITIVHDADIERVSMSNASTSYLLLEQGRKLDAERIEIHVGGGAVNAAVAMRRQGWQVRVVAKVGDDLNAQKVRERLHEEKVGDDLLLTDPEVGTGTAVMVSSHDRNASIFSYRGANTRLTCEELTAVPLEGVDLVYISSLSGDSADCFPLLAARADAAGAFVAANPGIRQLTSRAAGVIGVLPKLDLLTLNEVEAAALIPALEARFHDAPIRQLQPLEGDVPPLMRKELNYSGFKRPLADFMAWGLAAGVPWVLVTDGKDGAYLGSRQGLYYCPALKAKVAGTAGAGDAFAATCAAHLAAGADPVDALRAAAVNAASVVSYVDTQTGLLSAERLAEEVKASAEALPVRFTPWMES